MTTDTTAPDGLKACPFCGGEASPDGRIRYSSPLPDTWWEDGSAIVEAFYVNCVGCGVTNGRPGLVGGYQTRAEAIAAWNTRIVHEAPQSGDTERGDVVERWSWGYSDGTPGTPEYEPPRRICNWCKTVETRCQCDAALAKPVDAPANTDHSQRIAARMDATFVPKATDHADVVEKLFWRWWSSEERKPGSGDAAAFHAGFAAAITTDPATPDTRRGDDVVAGKTLAEWREFARRDDCLGRMVPSDLRQLVGASLARPVDTPADVVELIETRGRTWLDGEYTGKMDAETMRFSSAEMVIAFKAGWIGHASALRTQSAVSDAGDQWRDGQTGVGFCFDDGILNLNRDGSGSLCFRAEVLEFETNDETGKEYCYANLAASEIRAIRDELNKWFPPATITAQAAEIAALRRMVEQAATWFDEYASDHAAKAVDAGDAKEYDARIAKAARNSDRADQLRRTLLSTPEPSKPVGEGEG